MGMRQALSAGEVLTCDCFKTSGDLFLHLKSFSAFFTSYLPYPGLSKCLILQPVMCMGFPGGSAGKESTCNVGDLGSIPALGRSPGEGNGYPLQYSGLENSMDCMYSPWSCRESDTNERLSLSNGLGSSVLLLGAVLLL